MRLRTSKYYCLLFTVFSWLIAVAIIQKVILKVRQLLWMRHLLKWGYYLKKTFRHGLGYIGRIGTYYIGEAIIWMRHVLGKIFFSSFLRQLLTWGNYWCEAINHEITVSLLGNDHPYYANHIGLSVVWYWRKFFNFVIFITKVEKISLQYNEKVEIFSPQHKFYLDSTSSWKMQQNAAK